jgi:uncharacterized membrane protein YphA (DoxX/SURF4 family)
MMLASRVLLRWSWALLFAWFGLQQLFHPGQWTAFLPSFTGYFPMPGEMLVQLNGWLEICLATLLFVGYYTRAAALILAIHLAGIAITAGGAIGIRDFALAAAGFSLALGGADAWTLDAAWKEKTL